MPARKKSSNPFSIIRKEFGKENYGIKQFRSDVAKLKKKGLVSSKVDARSQSATTYMRNQIRKYADVLSGKAQVISVPRNEKKEYKEAGYKTKSNKVVIPTPKGQKVRRTKPVEGHASYTEVHTSETGKRTGKKIMVNYRDLEGMLQRTAANAPPLKKGEFYALEYYGNSRRTFKDLGLLLEVFMKYDSVQEAMASGSAEDAREVYRNFEIVKIENVKEWQQERRDKLSMRRNANRQLYNEIRNQKRRERYAKMDEFEKGQIADQRERNRESRKRSEQGRRDRMKADPVKYEQYLAAARVRKARNKK